MTDTQSSRLVFVTAQLPSRKPQRFSFRPDAALRAEMAKTAGLIELKYLHFQGEIKAEGRHDFRLTARLQADAVQPCSVTLAPVPALVDDMIDRLYLADNPATTAEEVEIPKDDVDDLPDQFDIGSIAAEALILALPMYPRADGALLGEAVFAEPGVEPLVEEKLKPFAGLAFLADRFKQDDPESGGKK